MSQDRKLFAMTGLFKEPNDIMKAAEAASKRYRKYDVHTPYPVHGMDDAMGLGESPIGWVTLIVGTTCMLLMLSFISWISLVDYPNVWAGKPYFNLPGYIPILFETTVLTGAVSTVIIMFVVVSGLPNNAHPLHDTAYMRRTSDDLFGLCIEAEDDNFSEAEAKAFLEGLGAEQVGPIYHEVAADRHNLKLTHPVFMTILAASVIGASGVFYFLLNRMVFMEPFNWMSVQPRVHEQAPTDLFADGRTLQKPVEGTISRGYMPDSFKDDPEGMAKYTANPLPVTTEVLELGQEKFESRCSPCHGYHGAGKARLNGQYPAPPTLHSNKVMNEWSDGRIYHVITYGQNVMPSYAKQLTKDERWAVIHYIRALQRSVNPKETDLE